ncbi:MAG TPA: chemotaxis protein CheE [Caulobacter sp.]|nr:chemotaxis protein CheE [Caulobacter sp.]
MSVVRKFKIRNRLREALFDGTGKRIDEAVADADIALAGLAEACMATVRACIAEMTAGFSAQAADRDTRSPVELYEISLRIIDACAPVEPKALADAARCLCDLLESSMETGVWRWPAVDVHIDALNLLSSNVRLGEAGEAQLIRNLAKLIQHQEAVAS